MRINPEDCDMPMPCVDDVTKELVAIPSATKDKYLPVESDALARLWVNLVKISAALGSILRTHYRSSGPNPGIADIERCEEEIQRCALDKEGLGQTSQILRLHRYQLQLFYE